MTYIAVVLDRLEAGSAAKMDGGLCVPEGACALNFPQRVPLEILNLSA